MLIKAPFISDNILKVTQEYGNVYSPTQALAYGMPFHNGTDVMFSSSTNIALDDARATYGTPCICPFDNATVVKVTWDTPTSLKGNGVTIECDNQDGTMDQIVFWHTGEIAVKIGQKLKLGDIVCYIGNSGNVSPAPTKDNPWAGAHCHVMLFRFVKSTYGYYVMQDMNNGAEGSVNSRLMFDYTEWYRGADTGMSHDMWALKPWLAGLFGETLVQYLQSIKFW